MAAPFGSAGRVEVGVRGGHGRVDRLPPGGEFASEGFDGRDEHAHRIEAACRTFEVQLSGQMRRATAGQEGQAICSFGLIAIPFVLGDDMMDY